MAVMGRALCCPRCGAPSGGGARRAWHLWGPVACARCGPFARVGAKTAQDVPPMAARGAERQPHEHPTGRAIARRCTAPRAAGGTCGQQGIARRWITA